MSAQATAFVHGEGDAWHRRNVGVSRYPDPVQEAIKFCGLKFMSVLEIGCGTGWRLQDLSRDYGCICQGLDPSEEAVGSAPFYCDVGTADNLLNIASNSTDMVIYGFCLYLVDREDIFNVVAECDRVLRDGGHVVIHDFYSNRPYCNDYKHLDGIKSYKQDYAKLWLASPVYRSTYQKIQGTATEQPTSRDDQVAVTILHKDPVDIAYPRGP